MKKNYQQHKMAIQYAQETWLLLNYQEQFQNKKYKICWEKENWFGNAMAECSEHSLRLSTTKNIFPYF